MCITRRNHVKTSITLDIKYTPTHTHTHTPPTHTHTHTHTYIYIQVSHELRSLLRESVPYVKVYRYNPKHLYPKLNGYGDNGKRSLKL